MNSIHDNQETIEKEKQEQQKREECAAEVTDATKALTKNQTEEPILTEEQIAAAQPLFTEEEIAAMNAGNEELQYEKDVELKKLQDENFELKKFISENSLHTKAQELKEEIQPEQPQQ